MNRIIKALKALKDKTIEPNIVRQALESINMKSIRVDNAYENPDSDSYKKYILMEEPFQVYLMNWSPQFFFPIHQHNNFWGFVIPIQGVLSETIYGYAANKKKVFIHPTKSYKPGELVYEPFNIIHKLQNTSPIEPITTIHIYHPPSFNFKGTTIFDAKNRTLAVLNEKAQVLSWDLPEDQYETIQEEAYTLEKLW